MLPLIVAAFLSAIPSAVPPRVDDARERIDLAILYAGDVEHERAQDWTAFLRERFRVVDAIGLRSLTQAAASGYDVVVADWRPRYLRSKGGLEWNEDSSPGYVLPDGFDKPVVMVGSVGGQIAPHGKIGWL